MNRISIVGGRRSGKTTLLRNHILSELNKDTPQDILVIAPNRSCLEGLVGDIAADVKTYTMIVHGKHKVYLKSDGFKGVFSHDVHFNTLVIDEIGYIDDDFVTYIMEQAMILKARVITSESD